MIGVGQETNTLRVLIIEDEASVCWTLERALHTQGYEVNVTSTAEDGLQLIQHWQPDVIMLDIRLPGIDGLQALPQLRRLAPKAAVIVMTAFGRLSTAVDTFEGGAFEYLPKPFDLDQALQFVSQATRRLSKVNPTPAAWPTDAPMDEELLGSGAAMQEVFKRVALAATSDVSVLILGESGVGKEKVAQAIHRFSPRRDQPFLPIHIAALSPTLVESELFGHVRGAYTGAHEPRSGLFSIAEQGTVFLDELAEIPIHVQVKLLRLLETKEFYPVGSNTPRPFTARILAATTPRLLQLIQTGQFRPDLYYRLNVFPIYLPPLRERLEDIPLLADYFRRLFAPESPVLPAETVAWLQQQPWPGNVRELRNALEHAVIVARGRPIRPEHLPTPATSFQTGATTIAAVTTPSWWTVSGGGPTTERSPTESPVSAGSIPSESASQEAATSPLRLAAAGLHYALNQWLTVRLDQKPQPPTNLYEELLTEIEPILLATVLQRTAGKRKLASDWLGLNRTTVRKKMARYGLADTGTDTMHDPESETGPDAEPET